MSKAENKSLRKERPSGIYLPRPIPPHPRLMTMPGDWERIRQQVKLDYVSARIFSALQNKAASLLDVAPLERRIDGFRLLRVSRQALERISLLAMVGQVGEDQRYIRRAAEEMTHVAQFSDWNPSHYLDTAELSLALAIGYDWLHEHLTGAEKEVIANAMLDKGIRPSFDQPAPWFIQGDNNWNQVCHAGLSAAAIAIADREPDASLATLRRAVENLPAAAAAYAPDGAYPEGPTYWNYGTLFHVVLADALLKFLGKTEGIDAFPGFAESAEYITQVTTPTGDFYPYADSRKIRPLLIPLFWFARRFHRPDWLQGDLENVNRYMESYESGSDVGDEYRLLSLALLWFKAGSSTAPGATKSLHWLGNGRMPVAAHRSAVNNSSALYAAIKGGCPSLNHAHMDVGSFMLQCDGINWAEDLGMQDYESLERLSINIWDASKKGARWNAFRWGPESHNILRFNGAHQLLGGNGQFIRFQKEGPTPHSVLDLTSLYADQVSEVRRGLLFVENRAVLIQDEWTTGGEAAVITWQMLTAAEADIRSRSIRLHQSGRSMTLQILDDFAVAMEVSETAKLQRPFDAPSPGYKRITLTLRSGAGRNGRLRVFAVPDAANGIAAPPFRSIADWS